MTTAVTTKEESAVAEFDPSMFLGDEGHENLDQDDYSTPFLKVLQKNSKECDEGDGMYIDGAKPGMYLNTGTGHVFESGNVQFVPVFCDKTWVEWVPYDQGGGIVRQYAPGETPPNCAGQIKVALANGNEAVLQHLHYGFIIGDGGEPEEVVFSCTSTQLTPSKKLNGKLRQMKVNGKHVRRFANICTLVSERRENDFGTWYRFSATDVRVLDAKNEDEAALFMAGFEMYKLITDGKIKVTEDQLAAQDDKGASASGSSGGGGSTAGADDIPF